MGGNPLTRGLPREERKEPNHYLQQTVGVEEEGWKNHWVLFSEQYFLSFVISPSVVGVGVA